MNFEPHSSDFSINVLQLYQGFRFVDVNPRFQVSPQEKILASRGFVSSPLTLRDRGRSWKIGYCSLLFKTTNQIFNRDLIQFILHLEVLTVWFLGLNYRPLILAENVYHLYTLLSALTSFIMNFLDP